MRCTIIRETGWTFATYYQQPSADVLDLLQHMHEEPPAHRILAWVNLKPKFQQVNRQEAAEQIRELAKATGLPTLPTSDEVRGQMDSMRQLEEQFRSKKKKK